MSDIPPRWTASDLLERYDGFAIDSYGVLIDGGGPIAHAREFVAALGTHRKEFLVVSNDASRRPPTLAARFAEFGIRIPEANIQTSGMLIGPWLRKHHPPAVPTIVLGPSDAHALVVEGGATIVAATNHDAQCVVVADDAGFDFVPTVEATLTTISWRTERALPTSLLLPNPDLIYPKPAGSLGLTAGSVAAVIEGGLRARFGPGAPTFERLGKPYGPIFDTAIARLGGRHRVCMLGDQIDTDIKGALAAGIHGILVETGVGRLRAGDATVPTGVLHNLALPG